MWAFQYKHGDRPLEGYTIQRAAGRGGFGEVYYAVSDSGREVALKVVQGYEAIELRGIGQCMNLKSPHLVSIFDVKHNHENKPFVIMEYVSGPNLRQMLDESPAGLGTQKAAFFLREIAKGLTYLHECGIVHRDLKPANIFYENGYVKIGDYGLSKHITTSQYSGQTVTVGTVHYMAPEIGAGKYDRSIDIYAMGALLFEMLTGTPPYLGSSPSEVLMKHLSSEPDVSGIPQPFARVIQKAMAKDPNQRYQSVQQMVEDVFGAEHVRESVSVFAPEDLSMIAERAAKKSPLMVGAGGGGGGGDGGSSLPGAQADPWARMGSWMDNMGGRVKQMWEAPPAAGPGQVPQADAANDPLPNRHRWMLAILVSLVAPLAAAFAAPSAVRSGSLTFGFVFTVMWGGALGLVFASRTLLPRLRRDSLFLQRLLIGQMTAMFAIIISLPIVATVDSGRVTASYIALLAPFFILDFRKQISPDRMERVQLGYLFAVGGIAFGLSMVFRGQWQLAVASAAGISLIVQVLSPWDSVAGARTKALHEAIEEAEEEGDTAKVEKLKAAAAAHAISPDVVGAPRPRAPHDVAAARVEDYANAHYGPQSMKRYAWRPVHPAARIAWIVGIATFITMGIMFCVAGGTTRSRYDEGPFIATGVASLLFGFLCIVKALQTRFYGWWGYFVKPLLMTVCAATITSSAIVLGNLPYNPRQDDVMIGTLFIVLPSILLIVLLFIPGKWPATAPAHPPQQFTPSVGASPYQRRWALLLSALIFGGFGGLQRIYVGKIGTGILYLLTGGLFLIGQIIDVIQILSGDFTDKAGRRLKYWESPPLRGAPPPPIPSAPEAWQKKQARPEDSPFDPIERAANECYDAAKNVVVGVTDELNAQLEAWRKPESTTADWGGQVEHNSWSRQPVSHHRSGSVAEINLRGLLSAVAGLLIFAATIIALALAIDVPGMLNAGVPTPQIKHELETGAFAEFPEAWPGLVRRLGVLTIALLMVFAFTLQVFARQRGGVIHMLRGVVGALGLILAMLPLAASIEARAPWGAIGPMVEQKRYPSAVDLFLRGFQSEEAVLAGVIFIVSIILLAWPARRPRDQRLDVYASAAPAPAAPAAKGA